MEVSDHIHGQATLPSGVEPFNGRLGGPQSRSCPVGLLLGLYIVIWVVRLLFVLFSVLFVCKCVLPPGDNPIAVNKYIILYYYIKGKGKCHPITGHEGPELGEGYISILPLTSALSGWWVVNTTSRPLYPRGRLRSHCIGGWVGPRAGLDGCGKSRPLRDSIPGLFSP
jgi:hypothetical protein